MLLNGQLQHSASRIPTSKGYLYRSRNKKWYKLQRNLGVVSLTWKSKTPLKRISLTLLTTWCSLLRQKKEDLRKVSSKEAIILRMETMLISIKAKISAKQKDQLKKTQDSQEFKIQLRTATRLISRTKMGQGISHCLTKTRNLLTNSTSIKALLSTHLLKMDICQRLVLQLQAIWTSRNINCLKFRARQARFKKTKNKTCSLT